MSHDHTRNFIGGNTSGSFNYLDETVRPSLYRNGEVMTKRDADGSDSGTVGMCLKTKDLSVSNARSLRGDERRTCEANGFELLNAPLEDDGINFFDHDQIVRHYYGQCTELVAQNTGGCAYAFDHNIRSVDPSRKSGGALHRLHCFCLEFDGACEVQRRVPTDWIIEPIDVPGYGSFSLAS